MRRLFSRIASVPIVIALTLTTMTAMTQNQNIPPQSPVEIAAAAHSWWFKASVCFAIVAAISAALFSSAVWRSGNRLQDVVRQDADIRIADARNSAAQANALATKLQLDVAQANERAAQATLLAEREAIARLELERAIAPRRITPAQRRAIAEALKPFAGRSVSIASFASDIEGSIFAKALAGALSDGGLTVQDDVTLCVQLTGGVAAGVFVNGTERDLVVALREILKTQGGLQDVAPTDMTVPCSRFGRGSLAVDVVVGMKLMPGVK